MGLKPYYKPYSVAENLNWAVTNKLPINVDMTNVMIVTGKRLESKLAFKPSVKFSDHELHLYRKHVCNGEEG